MLGTGTFFFLLGLLTLSRARDYNQVLLSQGLCMGFGGGLLYVPSLILVSRSFEERRTLTLSIVTCGIGIGVSGSLKVCQMLTYSRSRWSGLHRYLPVTLAPARISLDHSRSRFLCRRRFCIVFPGTCLGYERAEGFHLVSRHSCTALRNPASGAATQTILRLPGFQKWPVPGILYLFVPDLSRLFGTLFLHSVVCAGQSSNLAVPQLLDTGNKCCYFYIRKIGVGICSAKGGDYGGLDYSYCTIRLFVLDVDWCSVYTRPHCFLGTLR